MYEDFPFLRKSWIMFSSVVNVTFVHDTKLYIESLEAIISVEQYTVAYVVINRGQSGRLICCVFKLSITFSL
jgi:hypothetical protein